MCRLSHETSDKLLLYKTSQVYLENKTEKTATPTNSSRLVLHFLEATRNNKLHVQQQLKKSMLKGSDDGII
jgi:hypothetical protein